jgi:oligoribonuclease NrnB/cAMP/cGMP phosphodiesterase (DHH superfamily)
MSKCYHVFTHNDLDGAVSLLTLMWSRPNDTFHYFPVNNLDVIDKIRDNISNTHNKPTTFVLDLALREEFLPFLNESNITIIDHHKTSEKFVSKFNKSKVLCKEYSSNALLVRKIFAESSPELTQEQKMLIALADDFDSYKLQIPDSYDLNILFWSQYRNKFSEFIKDYSKGFKKITPEQRRAIDFIKKEASNEAEKIPLFYGELTIGGKQKKVYAGMVERIVPQVMDLLIQKYAPDIFFFINTKNEKVSIRQCTKTDPIDVGAFAERICEGGGHEYAAGGKITPLFMEVTKNLKPL